MLICQRLEKVHYIPALEGGMIITIVVNKNSWEKANLYLSNNWVVLVFSVWCLIMNLSINYNNTLRFNMP